MTLIMAYTICSILIILLYDLCLVNTVKPVKNSHSKTDKTKFFMTNGSLMKVESIAECSTGNTFDLLYAIIGLGNHFVVFLEWPFYTGFTVGA